MTALLFKNSRIFDGINEDCADGMSVLVADGRIQRISEGEVAAPNEVRVIDAAGCTLMPGMIDSHVHAFASSVNVQHIEQLGEAYRTAHAVRMLGHALSCGFTTVRDVGGGNYSLYRALGDGLLVGPRYYYAGKALSITGGHGDMRRSEERPRYEAICGCDNKVFNCISVIADGIDECVKAVRDEFRQGAHCIKVMASGGVASPTDPLWMNQYREDELLAIVNECTERRSYATAHCHPVSAIRRCVEAGVRCIEHASFIDHETAKLVAERGAFVVPTATICEQLVLTGQQLKFPPESQAKVEEVFRASTNALDILRSNGVKVCYGTDLLGATYVKQCREIELRAEVFTPLEILRQLTSTPAEMMMLEGEVGCIREGAYADLILVDGDPLKDISLLAENGACLRTIVRAGQVVN